MTESFDSLPWHDARLLELTIDRRNPGDVDQVRLMVVWPDGREATLLFQNCYSMIADMNFGVKALESIRSGSMIKDDPGLVAIRGKWEAVGVSLNSLSCYRLEMNSTASVIKIYAMHFQMIQADIIAE